MTNAAPLHAALIGNPNTGKSTLFNALSGLNVRTGNFPGVTVEAKFGKTQHDNRTIQLIDLPGTYSLAPRSLDEMVAVDVLLGQKANVPHPQVIVCVVDAGNLERNLYLFTQLLDLHLPIVLVLNMWDTAQNRGASVDLDELRKRLSVEVVTTIAAKGVGIEDLKAAICRAADRAAAPSVPRPAAVDAAVQALQKQLPDGTADFLVYRGLMDVDGEAEKRLGRIAGGNFSEQLRSAREELTNAGIRVPAAETRWRYDWIRQLLAGVAVDTDRRQRTPSDRIDKILTHQVGGVLVFALTMLLVFQAIYTWAGPLVELIEGLQAFLGETVSSFVPPGILRSLLVDGALAGVGSVVVFLPQILLLFLFISILEDCGYMARAAFLADRMMAPLGLNGRSFVPLMSSFACAVPGIMATRTIENWRDRMVTILIAPLMSCSARLPVYVLLTTAFIPDEFLGGWLSLRALVLFGMHLVGLVFAVPIAWVLRKWFFRGETSLFVMEMPTYKWPSPKVVLGRLKEQGGEFLMQAGTLIFCTSVVVWAAGYFPEDHTAQHEIQAQIEAAQASEPVEDARLAGLLAQQRVISGQLIEQSFLGRMGHAIAPALRPLGWDWKIGVAVIASFPAREVVIAAMGTIYSLGGEVDEETPGLQDAMRSAKWPDGRPIFTIPVALSIMVFFALCSQCAATLMVIKRETNSWRWPIVTFVYMTLLAYVAAGATYQIGTWMS
ncbi:MAG: ferrous iron transport protein B [Planctomycetaceae bacterium]|nr:ferrous iron transport protein B [Planctomycetaceae bacterium]